MVQAGERTEDRASDYPQGLSPELHRDASHRVERWVRRGMIIILVALLAVVATGAAGQTTSTTADGPLRVTGPDAVRGGLLYQLLIEIHPATEVRQPVIAVSDPFWESLSVNSIVPDASDDSYRDDSVVLTYQDPIRAGDAFRIRVYFQANPNVSGIRHGSVELFDGSQLLAQVNRRLVVLP
jgi:hypothetical protein